MPLSSWIKISKLCFAPARPDTPEIAREMKTAVERARRARDGIIWIDQMLDKRSVIQLYSHAGVFCCPSIYEPFGIINLEAMACETAVVASKVGGIKEVVIDRRNRFSGAACADEGKPVRAASSGKIRA